MKWEPVDIVILILVSAISGAMIMVPIGQLVLGESLSDQRSKTVSHIVGAVVGVISVYVGAKIQKHRDDKDDAPR